MLRALHLTAPLLALAACSTPEARPDSLVLATVFVNRAAEYDATCRGIYAAATVALEERVAALPEGSLPPAVVLDVDETVLDNSPFEVRLIEDGTRYPEGWDAWCNESVADPVPGVVEFLAAARSMDVEVFFVTNRKAHLEAGTRRNLELHGLFRPGKRDTLLLRGEREAWTRDKTSRREHVAETHTILQLFGDNVGDFFEPEEGLDSVERAAATAAHSSRWGRDWFMLPNPMYGGWDEAAVGHDYGPAWDQLDALRREDLDAKR